MAENGNGNGNVPRCPDCDRPVGPDGVTVYQGGPLPHLGKICDTCQWGKLSRRRLNLPEVQAKAAATQRRNAQIRNRRPSEVMQERVEGAIERVLRPYFEGLKLEPNEDWSPRTKLQFYNEQAQLSEKLLNRTEGLPIARTRTVDANDDDVVPPQFQNLPPDMLERVLVQVLSGAGGGTVTVEAEVVGEEGDDKPE